MCGRVGHQIEDCEEVEDKDEDTYSKVEEKEQVFGPWLRDSPLPKFTDDIKRETSSGTCSESLFSPTSNSKCMFSDKGRGTDDEVEQQKGSAAAIPGKLDTLDPKILNTSKEVEEVVESMGIVAITTNFHPRESPARKTEPKAKKWSRKKGPNAPRKTK